MNEQSRYRDPPFTVDAVIEQDNAVVLIKRGESPFKDMYALPGGHVDLGETPEDGVVREVYEETGLAVEIADELGDYSQNITDPRYEPHEFKHQAYHCTPTTMELTSGDDAADAEWMGIAEIPDELAFGHETIINEYLQQ